jgi:hypothetical protein
MNETQQPMLVLNHKLLDTFREYEVLAEGNTALIVDIVFADPVAPPVRHEFITEVHWRHATSDTSPRVAIESNILASGQTHDLSEIAFLRIVGLAYSMN